MRTIVTLGIDKNASNFDETRNSISGLPQVLVMHLCYFVRVHIHVQCNLNGTF